VPPERDGGLKVLVWENGYTKMAAAVREYHLVRVDDGTPSKYTTSYVADTKCNVMHKFRDCVPISG